MVSVPHAATSTSRNSVNFNELLRVTRGVFSESSPFVLLFDDSFIAKVVLKNTAYPKGLFTGLGQLFVAQSIYF